MEASEPAALDIPVCVEVAPLVPKVMVLLLMIAGDALLSIAMLVLEFVPDREKLLVVIDGAEPVSLIIPLFWLAADVNVKVLLLIVGEDAELTIPRFVAVPDD